MRISRASLVMLLVLATAACGRSDRDIQLRKMTSSSDGPDEFMVLPSKPLEKPNSYSDLPLPTPGSANLTDQYPANDAIAALGGRARTTSGGIPSADSSLVTYVSRNGVPADIRNVVAEDDRQFRNRRGFGQKFRIFIRDKYNETYKSQILDAFAETEKFRRKGIQTPSAPPNN